MKKIHFIPLTIVFTLLFLITSFVHSSGTSDSNDPLVTQPIPLPGTWAHDFETTAVIDDAIKKIKLSDYRGKYVYLTFIPAAFTFV